MAFNFFRVFQTSQPAEANQAINRFQRDSLNVSFSYSNRQAIVEQTITPNERGRVRFWGSKWFARCAQDVQIASGEVVDVIDIDNITLIVEPAFLLASSTFGLTKIRQAWAKRHWAMQNLTCVVEAGAPAIELLVQRSQGDISEAAAIETWKRFASGQPVYITRFKLCCEILGLNWHEIVGYGGVRPEEIITPVEEAPPPQPYPPAEKVVEPNPEVFHFVGRSNAISDINRSARSGARAIVILGEGGIGKTTLAQQYFQQQHYDIVLECWMAKQTQNISSAEGIVQYWLRRHFNEEPGHEFRASLEQLRRHLRQENPSDLNPKIGILIDNLEPALDRQGQIIEPHRDYVALLEVLADPSVRSLTLITSREQIRESTIQLNPYILPGLDLEAWRQFFATQYIQENFTILEQMHRAYNGNAKAMTILSSTISIDCSGDLDAFWRDHHADLLKHGDLEGLVTSQFDRLRHLYPEAYRLLLRLGCYRYQSISSVPVEALLCLLWDVPEVQHRSVIRCLEDLFLVEVNEGKYHLHPVIQAKAVALLKASPDWEASNRRAAEFWTQRVQAIETVEDALTAFQAHYHYLQINDWEAAANVLLYQRDSQWQKQEPLGVSFYRLGLMRRMISAIVRIIDHLQPGYTQCKLYNILGDLYWLTGNIHRAINCHEKAKDVAIAFELKDLEIVSLFNMGLCHIQLWELDIAHQLFSRVDEMAQDTEYRMYAVGSWFCLAFLNSCFGKKQEALELVKRVSGEYTTLSATSWGRGYCLLFLGRTLKNLGEHEQASKMYDLAKNYAEESRYTQVKARALNGLATIWRDKLDFQKALANHLAAQRILERIEARGDLAEVYYQLGLTYRKMEEPAESRANLQKAIALFQKMNAPRQVKKVQQVLESPD
ncbi:MAG: hypothetical protein Kow00121_42460 [Elainellaceae cyanobacterium]